MKKTLTGILIIFAMTLLNLAPVYAGHGGSSACAKCAQQAQECMVTKLKSEMVLFWAYKTELKITEDQLGKIAGIKHAAIKQLIRETAEAEVVVIDAMTELWAAQIDVEKINPLIDAKYAAKAKIARTYVKALADAQAVLNDEQRAKMKDIKSDRYIQESGVMGSKCTGKHCPLAGK